MRRRIAEWHEGDGVGDEGVLNGETVVCEVVAHDRIECAGGAFAAVVEIFGARERFVDGRGAGAFFGREVAVAAGHGQAIGFCAMLGR